MKSVTVSSEYLLTEPTILLLTAIGSFADGRLTEILSNFATMAMDHTSLLLINLSQAYDSHVEVITALIDIRTQAQVIGGDMLIVSPSTEVHSLICMMNCSDQLTMHGSQEEAIKALLNPETAAASG